MLKHVSEWVCPGNQLLGSNAMIKAQVYQIKIEEQERVAISETLQSSKIDKKSKTKDAFEIYKADPKSLKKDDWKDIMKFIIPILNPNTA